MLLSAFSPSVEPAAQQLPGSEATGSVRQDAWWWSYSTRKAPVVAEPVDVTIRPRSTVSIRGGWSCNCGTLHSTPLDSVPVDGTFLREESDPLPYLMVNGHKVRPIGIDADAVRVLWNGALAGIP
jgi:hypothetical protein